MKFSKEEAREFKERWRLANQRIDEELLNTPPEVKLKQLAALFEAAATFGWIKPRDLKDDQTWQRWKIIREFYAGSS